MSVVFMEMAEMAFQVAMEWDSLLLTKTMINRAAATTVQPLINRVEEVLGGGRVVDWPIQMASILGRQQKLQSPWLGGTLAISGSV